MVEAVKRQSATVSDAVEKAKRISDIRVGFDFDLIRQKQEQQLKLAEVNRRMAEAAEAQTAKGYRKRLIELANEFSAGLDAEHEVGARLVSFGQTVVFHLSDIGYYNPSLIIFLGKTDDGEDVTLIQHISQISVLFMKLKRLDPTQPKQPIGFHAMADGPEPKP